MSSLIKSEGVLFHYTTHESLHGIVESRSVWATHAYYLNDANEIRHAAHEMHRLLEAHSEANEKPKHKSFLLELGKLIQQLIGVAHYIFVFSVSEHRNLLSQWRAYTRHGSAVSIGFNKDDLRKLGKKQGFELVQCVYDQARREALLVALIDSALYDFDAEFPEMPDDHIATQHELRDFLNRRKGGLLKEFCRIKDPTFREEGEWRLVSRYFEKYTDPTIKFRPGSTTLIPYVEIILDGVRDDGYLFEQVYPGPSPNFEISYQAISAYMSNKRACKTTINPQSPWRHA